MEFEINGEEKLFDDSTNPSQMADEPVRDPAKPIDLKRKAQSGVLIPDEEEDDVAETQMG